MRSMVYFTVVAAFALAMVPAQAEVKLMPGVPIEFDVRAAPRSLAQVKRGTQNEAVRMTIKLPADYDPSRSYPVLVYLNGGDGGMGGELNQADPFMGGGDYILCNLPLFKDNVNGVTDDQQLLLTPRDVTYAVPAFRLMLNELRRLVPNLDVSRSVLAGFSNGAYAVALIVWSGDPELLSLFSTFVLVEGGFWLGADRSDEWPDVPYQPATFAGMRGKRVAIVYGDQTQPADRIPWIKNAQQTLGALWNAGIAAKAVPMPGVGHDFPPAEMAKVRAWVHNP